MVTNPLLELRKQGQSIWYDNIRRGLILSGELQRMIDEDGVTGVTSNPTIFDKAIAGSTDYEASLHQLIEAGACVDDLYEGLVVDDIQSAADVLRPVFDSTRGEDGYVSLEVSPLLAHDTAETVAQARHLWNTVGRPNVMIKVPATKEGIPAIEALIGEGINVNVTLIFSLDSYRQVAEAYIAGLERLDRAGHALNTVASVASFFVSRVDTVVDKLLEAHLAQETDPARQAALKRLMGTAAIASSKIAYQIFREIFGGPRFRALQGKGAQVQRVLWASTSAKNPAYRDVRYVEELIGPHTVNTMPHETLVAFRDHGRVKPTVEDDIVGARASWEGLRAAGIDMDEVTSQLLAAGVDSFSQSFDKLMQCISEKREGFLTGLAQRQTVNLGKYQEPVKAQLQTMDKNQFGRRLWSQDVSLWTSDPAAQAAIKNRLGWLHVMGLMREHAGDFRGLAREIQEAGFTAAVVLGMGGSSLCAEVFRLTYGPVAGYPKLLALDTTDPSSILALEKGLDLSRTLFIVSTKSGTTTETLSHYRYFFDRVQKLAGERAGAHFIAITDPGTSMETLARSQKFRRVYLNPANIGGRYSVLSYFGLVPAAIMGIDIEVLLDRAERMAHSCAPCILGQDNPALCLGAIVAELARQGQDKLTLIYSPEIAGFGCWAEQLIAESTGKQGKGIIPVDGEKVGAPSVYGEDRLFVYLRLESGRNDEIDRAVANLAAAGYPVVTLSLADTLDLGGEFFRWELATAVAGVLLGINPFDEPNVQESKDNTRRVLSEFVQAGEFPAEPVVASEGHLELIADQATQARLDVQIKERGWLAHSLASYLAAHLSQANPGDYVAIMAYVPYSAVFEAGLQRFRHQLRDALHLATTLGYGPRFLHSTGQLHKGGPDKGLFVQITADDPEDMPIPGDPYGFSVLKNAQARGDIISLQSKGRRVIQLHLKGEVAKSLAELQAALHAALSHLPVAS